MLPSTLTQQFAFLSSHFATLEQHIGSLSQTAQQSARTTQSFEEINECIQNLERAVEAQYETERALRVAIENALTIGIAAFDQTGKHIYANSTFCRIVGRQEAELLGTTPPFVYWCAEETDASQEVFQNILSGQCPQEGYQLTLQRANGECFQAQILAAALVDEKKGAIGWVVSIEDITRKKQTEEDLRKNEARFQRLIANMPGMVYRYLPCAGDSDAFTYVNSGCRELFELEPEVALEDASAVWAHIHPDDLQSLQESVAVAVKDSLSWHWEGRIITPSGQLKWIQGSSRPEQTSYGEVWDGLLVDITERKQMEDALRESETRFRQIAENIREVFFINSADVTQVLYISPAYKELWELGSESSTQQPRPWLKAIHPDDYAQVESALARQASGEELREEYRIIKSDGSVRWIFDRTFPIRDHLGQVCRHVGVAEDISDRKWAEEQIRASLREKELLLNEIHHRVKNNLQIISSLLYLQIDQLTDQKSRELIQNSRNRVESMALVHESLYESQNFAAINFRDYVQMLATNLLSTYSIRANQITLRIEVDPELRISLDQAIPCALIINELITNALQHGFCSHQSGEIFVTTEVHPEGQVTFSIGNSGSHLPSDFNIDLIQSMGLKLVTTLVKQLKGTMSFQQGEMTIFRVSFPLLP